MNADLRTELQRRLGNELLKPLSDTDVAKLHALLEDARRQQRDALVAAQQHALRFVPALLRKPLLALLGNSP